MARPQRTSKTLPEPDKDEFDLPGAEEYFAGLESKTTGRVTQEFLEEIADEFDDDDFDDGPADPRRDVPAANGFDERPTAQSHLGLPAADDFDDDEFDGVLAAHSHVEMPAANDFDDEIDLDEGSAALSCLGLPEILERIIVHVPPLEVYRLQRVNTMFRDLIKRSISIRRHMYFVPEKYFVRKDLNQALGLKSTKKSTLGRALHPFRFELYSHRTGAGVKTFPAAPWVRKHDRSYRNRLFPRGDKLLDKSASWRTIFILDAGAPLDVEFYVRKGRGKHSEINTQLIQSTPITLGDLVDFTKTLVEEAWRTRPCDSWTKYDEEWEPDWDNFFIFW